MDVLMDHVMAELFRTRHIDLTGYRRPILVNRLLRRMKILEIRDPFKYLTRLRSDPEEVDHLMESLLIRVSTFFRNPLVFELIGQQILPHILFGRKRSGIPEIRVWSAGCATGEEAYSIAILLHEVIRRGGGGLTPYIFATDISRKALDFARAGKYPRQCFEHTRLGVLDRYFSASDDGFEVIPLIRHMVRFSDDDLTSAQRIAPADSIFGTFDLILCRNVLIYFSDALQRTVFAKLYRALNRGGYLVLGEAESLPPGPEKGFAEIDSRNRIFQKPEQLSV
ncbi:chemotaxis protein CheR [Desulfonema ishimotonii]|uniref:Chemotaxis protein CheR n=1 Tax=Desulfonema ishimotonii TaxID=45657 RepID=A0A401FYQ9_9BACT|nr:protein-glutamate O-methyltransferase CheR [Desulfonema ishimotonii]GBC62099.1 chemotaxis protein CheR [Desulfonema ishimotonii]